MKKVLIIAYRFPPNNETGAFRPLSWAKYMKDFGYFPTVVTRHWDVDNALSTKQMLSSSQSSDIDKETTDNYEVYSVPFKGNLRTKILNADPIFKKIFYKIFYFLEQLLEYLGFYRFSIFYSFYKFTLSHLKTHQYDKVIITGGPFELFHLGHLIKKRFGIDWIADYRDPWTNRVHYLYKTKFPYSIIWNIEKKAEQRWLKNAFAITSTSNFLTDSISKYVNIKRSETIYNGYLDEDKSFIDANSEANSDPSIYNIIYNGNLFDFQPIERFLEGLKKVINAQPELKMVVTFAGVLYMPASAQRIIKILKGYENNYILLDRLPKKEYLRLQAGCDAMLLINSDSENGIVASKVFDYILTPKPIIILPDDMGPIAHIARLTGQAFIVNDEQETEKLLLQLMKDKSNKEISCKHYNQAQTVQFSRRNQAQKMTALMNDMH